MKNVYLNSEIFKKTKNFNLPFKNTVFGWGRKKSGIEAENVSKEHNKNLVLLEDGFIRSFFPKSKFQYSLFCDSKGIYYDSTNPSEFEEKLSNFKLNKEEEIVAQTTLDLLKKEKISKFNSWAISLPIMKKGIVLVIDQVEDDMSLKYGQSNLSTFELINIAIEENPEKEVFVKLHPNSKTKKEHIICGVIDDNVNPLELLEVSDKVYVRTSQLGFEALLLGKEVICFGIPFYSHLGLTEDRVFSQEVKDRRKEKSLLEVFWFAYNKFPHFINRENKQSNLKETINEIVELRKSIGRTGNKAYVFGFSFRKFLILKKFLQNEVNLIFIPRFNFHIEVFVAKSLGLSEKDTIISWGTYRKKQLISLKAKIVRVEDGFIRSKGLGSALTSPLSLVFDDVGIYFDATRSSRLEKIINSISLSSEEKEFTKNIINKINESKVSKYGNIFTKKINIETTKTIILVPGQVPSDSSLAFGAIDDIKTNTQLILKVREENPDAFIIYKQHPDIVMGKRDAEKNELETIESFADLIVLEGDIIDLIEKADEIHTITSTTGFEGLLRGKKVVCYGAPFYSGYGFTEDKAYGDYLKRRKRKDLSFEEFIYGILIGYPSYVKQNFTPSNITNTIESLKNE